MATGLANQWSATTVTDFQNKVLMAMVTQATNIVSEPATVSAFLKGGTVGVTSIPCTALSTAIAANAVISVSFGTSRAELLTVTAAGAALNATSIPINSVTLVSDHWMNDPISPPTAANHVNRTALANRVLLQPTTYMNWFIYGVASQAVDDTSTDAAINNAVSALWDAYAGRL